MRDWQDLARYREQSQPEGSRSRRSRVVFMGDSITDVWPRHSTFFTFKPYIDNINDGADARLPPDGRPQTEGRRDLASTNDIMGAPVR
jgi:hypothetical protein